MKRMIYECRCDTCYTTFDVRIAVDDRYDSIDVRHCVLCGAVLTLARKVTKE